MKRLAVLGSTRGTNLEPIFKATQNKQLNASIALVISNKADAGILDKAKQHGLAYQFVDPQSKSREMYDAEISSILKKESIDLIVLIGYMRILSADFVNEWSSRILNVHPSLLPAFAGKMDLDVHRSVIAAGETETGCSVHYVTAEVDAGPVLLQKKCAVLATDTPDTLKTRVQALEAPALIEAIQMCLCSSC